MLFRYRNFRTLTSPEGRPPCQYSCLAVDASGEVVVAGTLDSYEIYVWSMQTGRLLEVCVKFSIYLFIYLFIIESYRKYTHTHTKKREKKKRKRKKEKTNH